MKNTKLGLVLFVAGVLVIGIGILLKPNLEKTFITAGVGFLLITTGSLMIFFSNLPTAVLQAIPLRRGQRLPQASNDKEGLHPGWMLVILAFVAGFGALMFAKSQDAPPWITLTILAVALFGIGRGSYVATKSPSDSG